MPPHLPQRIVVAGGSTHADWGRAVPFPRLLVEKAPFLQLAVLSGLLTMIAGHHLSLSAPFEGVPIVTRLGNACLSYESVAFASAAVGVALLGLVARRQIGYWRDSVTLFERTLAVTHDNPVAHYLLGLAFQERGRPDDALVQWTEALRVAPAFAHAHASVGQLLFQRGQIDDTVAHYTDAIRLKPAYPGAHTLLGLALRAQGKAEQAREHFTQALRIDRGDATARRELGLDGGPQP